MQDSGGDPGARGQFVCLPSRTILLLLKADS